MPEYLINKVPTRTGHHEIHTTECLRGPSVENRTPIGKHRNCVNATLEAKNKFPKLEIDGCFYCASVCYTREVFA